MDRVTTTYLLRRCDGAYATMDLREGTALLVFSSRESAEHLLEQLESRENFEIVMLDGEGFRELVEELGDQLRGVHFDGADDGSDSVLDEDPEPSSSDTAIFGRTEIIRER